MNNNTKLIIGGVALVAIALLTKKWWMPKKSTTTDVKKLTVTPAPPATPATTATPAVTTTNLADRIKSLVAEIEANPVKDESELPNRLAKYGVTKEQFAEYIKKQVAQAV